MELLFRTAPWQKRHNPHTDPILMAAAQAKATDLATRDYANHVSPDGVSANQNLLNFGYPLPDWWDRASNQVESFAAGQVDVAAAFAALLSSPKHRLHIAGDDLFWASQDCFGVGYAWTPNSRYHAYYTVISAPCMPVG